MKFTIAIPAYKAKFLQECIESVLEQNYNNFEVVIVNDNSPQGIEEIVETFNDKRIRLYSNKVGFGAYAVVNNWNKCLQYATGDYFICIGDDDKLLPTCLSDYIKLIDKYPNLDIYHMRTLMIDEQSNIIDAQGPRPERESVYSMIWNLWKGRDQYIGDFLFRTEKLKEIGGFYFLPCAWSSDKITTFLMAQKNGIANTTSPGFLYRKNSQNITSKNGNQRYKVDALISEKKWYHTFVSHGANGLSDNLDEIYFRLIKTNIDLYMTKRINSMLIWDVTDNPSHIFWWFKKKKQYELSNSTIHHLMFVALKETIRRIIRH